MLARDSRLLALRCHGRTSRNMIAAHNRFAKPVASVRAADVSRARGIDATTAGFRRQSMVVRAMQPDGESAAPSEADGARASTSMVGQLPEIVVHVRGLSIKEPTVRRWSYEALPWWRRAFSPSSVLTCSKLKLELEQEFGPGRLSSVGREDTVLLPEHPLEPGSYVYTVYRNQVEEVLKDVTFYYPRIDANGEDLAKKATYVSTTRSKLQHYMTLSGGHTIVPLEAVPSSLEALQDFKLQDFEDVHLQSGASYLVYYVAGTLEQQIISLQGWRKSLSDGQ